ncbi:uncharacterized protein LOC110615006 [Manihot esculenta]|uniref:Uncharacterized protein n=1 Tax=Manihot esculenta TaxID=3983 RepID=A0A2C9VV09_MANES|nr:uncharacterized protein LOC110615006 [Manihot esculenta]OAY50075.1 hypothetical protein MANES_05G106200v8 [Manihot esculenta]
MKMEGAESLDEWEQVQLEIVAVRNNSHVQDDLSVFPPSYHEDLQLPPPSPKSPPDSPVLSRPSSVAASNSTEAEEGLPLLSDSISKPIAGNEFGKRLRLRFEILRSGICWIVSRARGGSGFWSFASVSVVVATAVLLYSRVQRWRQRLRKESENRLIHIIKEKDQKISQLLLQIAQMNEMISARKKVPVIRVA